MPEKSDPWRGFVEEESYAKSVVNCGGHKRTDEITLVYGWALSNKPECYEPVIHPSAIRMLQTREIPWTNPPTPPMRIFFKIQDEDKILLLYIEEDE